jgi:outer membrane protein TolC
MFSLQQNKLDASRKLLGVKTIPHLFAFGQLGYGRPGFDMLKNEFTDFYIVGAKLNWNFWDWNHTKKEKEILGIQNDILNTQKETFDKNIRIDLENKKAAITKAAKLIIGDEEIIGLRKKITTESSSQLDHGVITSTEYLSNLNAESQAELNLEIHKIQLIKAKIDYQATLGNL